jgi:hypothetical protein
VPKEMGFFSAMEKGLERLGSNIKCKWQGNEF